MFEDFYSDMPDFTEHGAPICAQTDPDLFFPKENFMPDGITVHSSRYESESSAKALCGTCPYAQRCLEYALENPGVHGIWGGTAERDRLKLRKAMSSNNNVVPLQIKTR